MTRETSDVCDRWPYPCDSSVIVNPTFDFLLWAAWVAALTWGVTDIGGRTSAYGAKAPLTPEESALRGRVAMIALLAPPVIQIGACMAR